jgi:hypothetical protein
MPKNILSIGDIIEKEEDLKPFRSKVKEFDIVLQFSVVFPELKQIAEAVKVVKNVLYLKVENSVWRSELRLRQKSIVDKINRSFNEESIKSIKFI